MDHLSAGREVAARRGLLLVVAAAAATAVLGGLARLGVDVGWAATRAGAHGPLFVLGVFGTVIGLERAVALAAPWSYAAPVVSACAAVATLVGVPGAAWGAAAAGALLVAVNAAIVRRQSLPFTWLMLLGSAVFALGTAAWAVGRPVFQVVPAWIGFFVLTIVAERLELSRLAPTPAWATRLLVGLASCYGLVASAAALGAGVPAAVPGGTLALLALWQLRFDIARRTVRQRGLPRFAATGVLLGAGWLLVAGVTWAALGLEPAGLRYDAVLHAVLVGFVLSMVFAHAPIILPAVARIAVPFHPLLYLPLAVLHVALAVRVAGDLLGIDAWRRAGGLGNAVALALFFVAVVAARRRIGVVTGRGHS